MDLLLTLGPPDSALPQEHPLWFPCGCHTTQALTNLVPGFDGLYSAKNHSCGGRAQEMHPKVPCCNSLCNVGNNISIHKLSYLPREECIASWRRMKYFTSSLAEGKESRFNPVPGGAFVLGQTLQL